MFSTHYVKVGRCIFAHGPGPRLLDRAADGEAPLPHSLHGQAGASSETTAEQQNGPSSGLDRASQSWARARAARLWAGPGPGLRWAGHARQGRQARSGQVPTGRRRISPRSRGGPTGEGHIFLLFFFNLGAARVMAPKWPGGLPKHGKTSKILIFPQKGIKNMR